MQLAVIGTSKIAESYIKSFKSLGVNVTSIYSRQISRAKKIAEQHQIKTSTDNLNTILDDSNLNGVVIVTEPDRHIDIAQKFLERKKNILIEKPLDIDLKKIENFLNLAKNSNLTVQVASQYYFDPIVRDFKKKFFSLIDSEIGFLNINIFYYKNKEYFLNGNQWRKKYSNPIFNQGIHWFDFIIDLFGECQFEKSIKENIQKYGDSYDNVLSILRFKNNKFVTISASTNINNKNNFFSYTSANLNYSYKNNFYNQLFFNPFNLIRFRSSYRHHLQCKNFLNNINKHTNDHSLLRAYNSLKLINKILS